MRIGLKRCLRPIAQSLRFMRSGFQDPAPNWVKWRVLNKHFVAGGTCVETGTYLGETTEYLGRHYPQVYSLEPYLPLFQQAVLRFRNSRNIIIVNKGSEAGFEEIVRKITGPVNFWLDGHFSGSGTYEGEGMTPIEHELAVIRDHQPAMTAVTVAVDDFRLFRADGIEGYPSPNALVNFANENGFEWTVERGIFIMKRQAAKSASPNKIAKRS